MEYIFDYGKDNNNNTNISNDEYIFDYGESKKEDNVDILLSNIDEYDTDADIYNQLRNIESKSTIKSERDKAKIKADEMESGLVSSALLGIPQGLSRIGKGFAGLANVPADIAESLGYDVLPRVSSEKFDDITKAYEPAIDSEDYVKRTANVIGQATPLIAAGGAVGYGAMGLGAAEGTAALSGAIATGIPMGAATKEEALKSIPKSDPYRMTKAYASGAAESLLESAGNFLPMARLFNKFPALKSKAGNIVVGMIEGTVGEGAEEWLQGIVKPYIEKGEITQKDWDNAWTSAKYGMASGGIIGGTIGSMSKVNKDSNKLPVEPINPPTVETLGYKIPESESIFKGEQLPLTHTITQDEIQDRISNVPIDPVLISDKKIIGHNKHGENIYEGSSISEEAKQRIKTGNNAPINPDPVHLDIVPDNVIVEPLSKETRIKNAEKLFDDRYKNEEIEEQEGKNFNDLRNDFYSELSEKGISKVEQGDISGIDEEGLPILQSDKEWSGSLRDDNNQVVVEERLLGKDKTQGTTVHSNVKFKDGKFVDSKGKPIDSTGLIFYDNQGNKVNPLDIEAGTINRESYISNPSNVEGIIHESIHNILNSDEKFKNISPENKEKIVMGAVRHYFVEEIPLITDKLGDYDGIIKKFVKGVVKQHRDMIPRIVTPKNIGIIDKIKSWSPVTTINNLYNDLMDDSGKSIDIINNLAKLGNDKLKFKDEASRQAFVDSLNKRGVEESINKISRSEGIVESKINNSNIPELISSLKSTGMNEDQISELFIDSLNVLSSQDIIDENLGFKNIDIRSGNKYKKLLDKLPTETTIHGDKDARYIFISQMIIDISRDISTKLRNSGIMKTGDIPIGAKSLFPLLKFEDGSIDSVKKLVGTMKRGKKNPKLSGDIKNPLINVVNAMVQVEKNVNKNNFIKDFVGSIETAKDAGIDTSSLIRKISPNSKINNKISFFENGNEQTYWMSPEVQNALESMYYLNEGKYIKNKQQLGQIMGKVLGAADILRTIVTKIPAFGIRNFIRDLQAQLFTSTGEGMLGSGKQLQDELGKYEDVVKILTDNGIVGDRSYVSSKQDFYKNQMDKAEDIVKSGGIILDDISKIGKIKDWYIDKVDNLNDKSETYGRTNEFKRSYLLARNKLSMDKNAAIKYALDRTQDIMNFQKSGSNIRYIGSMIPFMNANIQGLRKLAKPIVNSMKMTMKNDGTLTSIEKTEAKQRMKNIKKTAAIYASLTMLSEAWKNITGGDDLSDDVLNNYWQISLGPGNNIMVPKAFEDSVISNIFRNTMDLSLGNETGYGKTLGKFAGGLVPPMNTPMIEYGKDFYDIWFNGIKKNPFTGKTSDIVRDKMASTPEVIYEKSLKSLERVGGTWYRTLKTGLDVPFDLKKTDVPYSTTEKVGRLITDILGLRTADYRRSIQNISILEDFKSGMKFELDVLKRYNKSYNKLNKSLNKYKNRYYKDKTPDNKQKVLDAISRLNKFSGKFVNAINKYRDKNRKMYERKKK